MGLKDFRKEIDKIDDNIFDLFQRRMELGRLIAIEKEKEGLPILNKSREEEILNRMEEKSSELKSYMRDLFNMLFSLSKDYQKSLVKDGINDDVSYGLLGKTLKHSFSKEIHSLFGDYPYQLFERDFDQLESLIKEVSIKGLNVTIPYKETVMKYCDEVTDRAKRIGCVNTLIKTNDMLIGENTDYDGFSYLLDSLNLDVKGKFVVILGNGATSRTASAVLSDRGAYFVKLSRREKPYFSDVKKFEFADILVNTTPVGMYPDNGSSLVNLDDFKSLEAVIDVVYNPLSTKLVSDAKKRNIPSTGGLAMLVVQAARSSELFTGIKITDERIKEVINKLSIQSSNIILVGMPGSGKTTIGRELSRFSGREMISIDQEIEKEAGLTIPEIFKIYGEDYFRDLETRLTAEFGKKTGIIIATGGGVIKRRENYYPLAQNGRIYFVERDLDNLEMEGRPLSTDRQRVSELWEERKDLYAYFSDVKVENHDIEKAAEKIWEDFNENFND